MPTTSLLHKSLPLVIACLAPLGAQADMLAVTFGGSVYDVDSASGAATALQASGPSFNALASDGVTYWSVVTFGGQLATLNPTTGVATLGVTLSGLSGDASIRGLAFSGGTLYGIQNTGGATTLGPDSLYSINTSTGAATLLGATGFSGVQALAADAAGGLFAWDVGAGLLRINAATGAATAVATGFAGLNLQTLAFSPTGVLYGAADTLYTVDTSTSVATTVGVIGVDVRGIEFTTAVPEPGTWALMALGLAWVGGMRRKRQA